MNITVRIFLILLLFCCQNTDAQTSPIWGNLEKGKNNVGFKVYYKFDYSRIYHGPQPTTDVPFSGEDARPIRISVWYPTTTNTSSTSMKYKDYIFLEPADKEFSDFNKALVDYDYWATINWTDKSQTSVDKLMNMPVEAQREAKPAAGKHPVIVHFLGLNDRRNENIPFWEFLASHGYVVITVPQLTSFGDVSMELYGFSLMGREMQVRDMEFAIAQLHDLPFADFHTMGVIGYSYGSVFAVRMAMLNPSVKAIATFDGNINRSDNIGGQSVIQNFYNPKIKVDWINIYRARYDPLDLKVHETLKYTNRYRFTLANANHGDFEDFAMATSLMPEQAPAYALKERSVATGKSNYEITCQLTKVFFDRALLKKNTDVQFDALIKGGKDSGIIEQYEFKKAKSLMDEEDLAHIIIYNGIKKAEEIYKSVKTDPEYEVFVTADDLLKMARALRMGGRRLEKSNEVFIFLERNFPENIDTLMELAKNYLELKNKAKAIGYLQKILGIDKENQEAKDLMIKLQ